MAMRIALVFGVATVNVDPKPVTALTTAVGRPNAASDPTMLGCKAT
jgi:hypothetical protein